MGCLAQHTVQSLMSSVLTATLEPVVCLVPRAWVHIMHSMLGSLDAASQAQLLQGIAQKYCEEHQLNLTIAVGLIDCLPYLLHKSPDLSMYYCALPRSVLTLVNLTRILLEQSSHDSFPMVCTQVLVRQTQIC